MKIKQLIPILKIYVLLFLLFRAYKEVISQVSYLNIFLHGNPEALRIISSFLLFASLWELIDLVWIGICIYFLIKNKRNAWRITLAYGVNSLLVGLYTVFIGPQSIASKHSQQVAPSLLALLFWNGLLILISVLGSRDEKRR